MIRLETTYVLAKPSPAEDFQLVPRGSARPPEAVEGAAGAWLQAHLDSGNAHTSVLLRQGPHWWSMHATADPGVDNAGRPICHLAFGPLESGLSNRELAEALLGAYQARVPAKLPGAAQSIPRVAGQAGPGDGFSAALSLALGAQPFALVGSTEAAEHTLDALGQETIDFLVLMATRLPSRMPAGRGIVLSQLEARGVPGFEALHTELLPAKLNLAALARLPVAPERRQALLAAVLQGEPLRRCSPEELDWLLDIASTRTLALACAGPAQVRRWLESGSLGPADLDHLKEPMEPLTADAVARLLEGQPDAARRFARLFGPGHPEAIRLLPEAARRTWDALSSAEGSAAGVDPHVLGLLEESGVASRLGLEELAGVRERSEWMAFSDAFEAALRAAGVPGPFVELLCAREASPRVLQAQPPQDTGWVRGVSPRSLLEAGRVLCDSTPWRNWWTRALECHPALGAGFAGPGADWSEPADWWLRGSMKSGETSLAAGIRQMTRWKRSPAGPGPARLVELLRDAGFRAGGLAERLLLGELRPGDEADPAELPTLEILCRNGFLETKDLVDAVRLGCSPSVLAACAPAGLVALLDPEQAPPIAPSGHCPPALAGLLGQAASTAAFWRRWRGTLTVDMAAWLASELAAAPSGSLAQAAAGACRLERRLSRRELELLTSALASPAVCSQCVSWAAATEPDRTEALELLLAAPGLRPELAGWLRSELLDPGPPAYPPRLSAGEMTVLLPLLQPVRDVVRVVMSRTTVDPDEVELLGALSEALRRNPGLPPPAPAREAAGRRPEWTATLGSLPGWQCWADTKGER